MAEKLEDGIKGAYGNFPIDSPCREEYLQMGRLSDLTAESSELWRLKLYLISRVRGNYNIVYIGMNNKLW